MSFLRKQESIFGRCHSSGSVDSCFRRNDRLSGRIRSENLIIEY
ncbi:Uncharacterized protein dnm_022480 [Desulfonema magnum]|uniref:Uncharacterized protein n=1 Tax=Desulfonema magnum TaxID=45655 RepID=A0A975BIL7_9BACT|nr:Uncharacterized protein dnm_022480 [Desulfonema magnum]